MRKVNTLAIRSEHSAHMNLDCYVEIVHKPMKEKGEDAFALNFESNAVHYHAVFDGCGGSGSWQYAEFNNATGAFVAAQSMAKAFIDWSKSMSPEALDDSAKTENSFHAMAQHVLSDLKRNCAPMKVSGSLVKSFPCTASVSIAIPHIDYLALTTLNVGDSRVYFIAPQTGLVQLTVDDSQGDPDPMESLRDSAPLSDMLYDDNPFKIKTRQVSLTYPCAIVTATDGVFGFFRSPMDFEYCLLDAIMRSSSFAQFEESFKNAIVKVTGDDSTCIISFYGWGSFDNLKRKMVKRYEEMRKMAESLDKAMENGSLDDLLEATWQKYKKQTLIDEMQG